MFLGIYIAGGVFILVMMIIVWLISLVLKDSSIVDIFWGTGFVLVNWFYFGLVAEGDLARQWLVGLLVTIWGLRLSAHIFWRNRGKGEDFRYQKWRNEAGKAWWWRSFFKVFLLQGAVMWLVSAPLLAVQLGANRLNWLDYVAVVVWAIGFFFEAVGDWQLARFKADPTNKGKLLTTGLWRYTRHPNYFGDAVQWWAFYLFAAATSGGAFTIFSPLLMTFLLVRVSGVAMLEKSLKDTKPGYEQYIQNTNAFIPWLPGSSD